MISANDVSTNKQAKIAYTTTDKGRPHLWEWLEVSVGKNEMRYETLLKLFFGEEIRPKKALPLAGTGKWERSVLMFFRQ